MNAFNKIFTASREMEESLAAIPVGTGPFLLDTLHETRDPAGVMADFRHFLLSRRAVAAAHGPDSVADFQRKCGLFLMNRLTEYKGNGRDWLVIDAILPFVDPTVGEVHDRETNAFYRDLLSLAYGLRFLDERDMEDVPGLFVSNDPGERSNLLMFELLSRGADASRSYVDIALGTSASLLHRVLSNRGRTDGTDTARLLLEYGADIDALNAFYFSPLDVARMQRSPGPLEELLIEWGRTHERDRNERDEDFDDEREL